MNGNSEYLSRRSRSKYSPIFTKPEAKNCFNKIFRVGYHELKNENNMRNNTQSEDTQHTVSTNTLTGTNFQLILVIL